MPFLGARHQQCEKAVEKDGVTVDNSGAQTVRQSPRSDAAVWLRHASTSKHDSRDDIRSVACSGSAEAFCSRVRG